MEVGYFRRDRRDIIKCYRNTETQREFYTKAQKRGKDWRLVGEYQNTEIAFHFARQHLRLFISSGFDVDKSLI